MKRVLLVFLVVLLGLTASCQRPEPRLGEMSLHDRIHGKDGYVFETIGVEGGTRAQIMRKVNVTDSDIVDLYLSRFKYAQPIYIPELDLYADVVFSHDGSNFGGGRYFFSCTDEEFDEVIDAISKMLKDWTVYEPMEDRYPFAIADEDEIIATFTMMFPSFIYRIHADGSWMKLSKESAASIEGWDIEHKEHIFVLQVSFKRR